MIHFGQGAEFYTQNPLFWWKVGLYLSVGGLSLYPTITYILWAIPLRKGELPKVSEALAKRLAWICLLYTSPSPRDIRRSRMPSSA